MNHILRAAQWPLEAPGRTVMNQVTRNSHYIAEHLTRPWTFTHPKWGANQVWFYDFDADRFDVKSGRTLYTLDEPLPQQVEDFFNRWFENPLGRFLARQRKNRRAQPNEEELRALKLSFLFQKGRNFIQREVPRAREYMDAFSRKDEKWLNNGLWVADRLFEFFHFPIRQERLFFPDTAIIDIPFIGEEHGAALPVHPAYLVVAAPRSCRLRRKQLEALRVMDEREQVFTALSVGRKSCRRVVIPGSLWGRSTEDRLRQEILQDRERAKVLTSKFDHASRKLAQELERLRSRDRGSAK